MWTVKPEQVQNAWKPKRFQISVIALLLTLLPSTLAFAAEVTIGTGLLATANAGRGVAPQTVFVSDLRGYAFYVNSAGRGCYKRTTDGGATWSAEQIFDNRTGIFRIAIWYDRWTPGDTTGNFIHVFAMESTTSDVFYQRIDTTGGADTLGVANTATVSISTDKTNSFAIASSTLSACKATTGDMHVAVNDSGGGGASWIKKCTFDPLNLNRAFTSANWVNSGSTTPIATQDANEVILMPLAGGGVLAIELNSGTNAMRSYKLTGTTWGGVQAIDTAADNTTTFAHMAATVDPLDNTVYLVYCADVTTLGVGDDDVRIRKYNGTAWNPVGDPVIPDPVTNDATKGITDCAIAIDRSNRSLYVAYLARTTPGTATTTNVYWKSYSLTAAQPAVWSAESTPLNTAAANIEGVMLNVMSFQRMHCAWWVTAGTFRGCTIVDLLPVVSISATDTQAGYTVGTGTYRITRQDDTYGALTVNYTVGGTATSGTDFTALSGSVSFTGDSDDFIDVTLTAVDADTTAENDETAVVTLAAGTYTISGGGATVTIIDDDTPDVTLAMTDSTVTEGSANTGAYTVTRVGNTLAALNVLYSIGGTATNTTDYATLSGTATIPLGSSSTTITVDASGIADTTAENDESVSIQLSADAAYNIVTGGPFSATIIDDDLPAITLSVTDSTATEGSGADTAVFTVTRVGNTLNPVTVNYSVGGSATSGSDFTALSGSVTIAASSSSNTVVVSCAAAADTTPENDETVSLTVSADAAYTISAGGPLSVTLIDNDTPSVTLALTDGTATEGGADTAVFTVTRVGNTLGALNVLYSVGGTATSGSDFAALSGTCTIAAGTSSNTITVDCSAIADTTAENDQTVQITLTTDAAYSIAAGGPFTATLIDNDTPDVSIATTDGAASEPGADTGLYTITRVGSTLAALTVNFTVGGTATSGTDYTSIGTSVNIPIGQQSATVTVTPLDNAGSENDETVVVTLDTGAYNIVTPGAQTVTIVDNDLPTVTIAATDATATENGDTATYTVTRVGNTLAALIVNYSVTGGATSGSDYVALSEMATIPIGQSTATITLTTVDNGTAENDETVILTIDPDAAYVVGAPDNATATIIDDETPEVSIVATDATATENADSGTFTISRVGNTVAALTVNFTVTGTAASGTDYTAIGTSAVIPLGAQSTVVTITTVNNGAAEYDETVTVTLDAGAYSIVAPSDDTVTIIDDELPEVTIVATDNLAAEPGTDTGLYTITRVGHLAGTLEVFFNKGGTANSSDYDPIGNSIVIGVGQPSVTITLTAVDDLIAEPDETVIVTILPDPAYTAGAPDNATVTIQDDENTITIAATTPTGAEPDGVATFTVTRTGSTLTGRSVNYSIAGTATANGDYVELDGVVTIAAGATTAEVYVQVLDDTLPEGDETVIATLQAGVSYQIGAPNAATVTIIDNDPAEVSVVATDAYADEAAADTGIFTVSRIGSSTDPLTVYYTVGGTATAGVDYTALAGSVIIPAGQPSATIVVTALDDLLADNGETVIVTLSNDPSYTVGGNDNASVTLVDDEAIVVSLTAAVPTASEPTNAGKFTLSRNPADATNALTVGIKMSGTATNTKDYTVIGTTVTFPAGAATVDLNITPIDDATAEADETAVLTLQNTPAARADAVNFAATVTIVDNENAVSIVAQSNGAEPATNGVFRVSRTGGTTAALTVTIAVSGTATAVSDYTSLGTSVIIPAGASFFDVDVVPVDDANKEADETVTVTLIKATPYVLAATNTSATVTLVDNEPRVSIAATTPTAVEPAGVGVFTITRTDDTVPLTVYYTVTGTAVGGPGTDDYDNTLLTGQVDFLVGSTAEVINIPVLDDLDAENDETVVVTITPDAANFSLGTASATVTIICNELPEVKIQVADAMAQEPGAASGSFLVTRTGNTLAALKVYYTVAGSAGAGLDYVTLPGKVTIPAGQSTAAVVILALDDTEAENDEGVELTLTANSAYTLDPDPQDLTGVVAVADNEPPVVTISATAPAAEGGADGSVTIHRRGNTLVALKVPYTIGAGSTAGIGDYVPPSLLATIPIGSATVDIPIVAVNDGNVEDDETVEIALTPPVKGYTLGTPSSGTALIADDELRLSIAATTPTVPEQGPGTAIFTVSRTGDTTLPLGPISYTVLVASTATSGTDYTALSGTITIPGGAATETIVVTPIDDGDIEPDETVIVELAVDPTYSFGAQSATVKILDDEPRVTIVANDATAGEPNNDGEFTVSRSGPTGAALVVNYTVSGTATAGGDYTALAGSVTLGIGVAAAPINVAALDDAAAENDETVIVTIDASPAQYSLDDATKQATVTLVDDELPEINVAASDNNASEPGSNTGTFTVTRTGNTIAPVTVNYTVSGTATSTVDFTALSGSVTIPAGQASATVTVTALNNTVPENDETVILTITPDAAYTVGAADDDTVTIVDEDKPLVCVLVADNSADEQGLDPATFTVKRTGNTTAALTVTYKVTGKAANGVDYALLPLTIDIPAGQQQETLTLTPLQDTLVEPTEDVSITIVKVAALYNLDAVYVATANILDNEPRVSVAASDPTGTEDGDTAEFTVSRVGDTTDALNVNIKLTGTAKVGIDYTNPTLIATIPAGQASVPVTISTMQDTVPEVDETVILTLATGTGYGIVAPLSATVTLADDEPKVSIVANDPAASESGDPGQFTVTRTTTSGALVVVYTVTGTAKKGEDYVALPLTLTIPDGSATATIDITTLPGAGVPEQDETVIVTLKAGATYAVTAPTSGTVTIADDETRVTIAASVPGGSEAGPANGEFIVTRTGDLTNALTVNYTVSGTATAGDYTALPMSVVIGAGDADEVITVTPIDDNLLEASETVIVTLTPNLALYSLGAASATVTIADDEAGVSIAATDATSLEASDTGVFTVTRSGDTTAALTVNFTVGGTATSGADFTPLGTSVVIPAGQLTANITVTSLVDLLTEGAETVLVTLVPGATYSVAAAPNDAATVTINNNENLISIAATDPVAAEPKNTGAWTISRTGSTALAMTVSYTISGTALNGKDYKLGTTAKFKPGQASVTVLLKPNKDTLIEGNETVTLTLVPSAAYNVDPTPATVTIQDLPVVNITAVDATALELPNPNDAGAFVITRTGSLDAALPLKYKVSGTAKAKTDYVALPKVLSIPAGQSSLLIPVTTVNNGVVNTDRAVTLSIAKNTTYNNGPKASATVVIVDGSIAGN